MTAEDGAGLGVIIEPPAPAVLDVHPDAAAAIEMFFRIATQWRAGPGGAIGLDYSILLGERGLFSLYQVSNPMEMLEDLQVMEAAVLGVMAEAA